MRHIVLNIPTHECDDPAHLARLTRHLRARMEDLNPTSPQITQFDPKNGLVGVRPTDMDSWDYVNRLERLYGIFAAAEENDVVFFLNPDIRFEDLDYVWGCLFQDT